MDLEILQSNLDKIKGKKEQLEDELEELVVEERINKKDKELLEKCMKLLNYVSKMNQEKVVNLFEYTISSGLKDLFDGSYDFRFLQKSRGNNSACDFELKSSVFPGWSDLVMAHGKSVQDIVSVILRIVLVKLDKHSRRLIILDEPLSGLESSRMDDASTFLHGICERFNIQLIMVTHSKELQSSANKVIKLRDINKRS
jgi:DNA repair exonuclease SbcCD ATPase subunit